MIAPVLVPPTRSEVVAEHQSRVSVALAQDALDFFQETNGDCTTDAATVEGEDAFGAWRLDAGKDMLCHLEDLRLFGCKVKLIWYNIPVRWLQAVGWVCYIT